MNAALHVCFSDGRTCVAWHWYNSDTVSTCTKKHLKEICMIPKAIVKRCQQNSHKLFGVNMIAFWVWQPLCKCPSQVFQRRHCISTVLTGACRLEAIQISKTLTSHCIAFTQETCFDIDKQNDVKTTSSTSPVLSQGHRLHGTLLQQQNILGDAINGKIKRATHARGGYCFRLSCRVR